MSRVGRYEITGELGRGGMGVVYSATDTAIGRAVAVKVVRPSESATTEEARNLRERLVREARAAGSLAHPNIVAVHDFGQEGDTAYIVMELVRGRTLESVLAESAPHPPEEWALRVLADVARGLDYAHARGVCHRDVKPANIMVDEDGGVKIADFGIAKMAWTNTMTITPAGMVMGSPHYMAPEQLMGGTVTGRTDQFALAGVAYTLLTGRRPFQADTLASLVAKILHQEPASIQILNPSLRPETQTVLNKAMAKNPADRFPSCAGFVEALAAASRPAAETAAPPEPEAKPARWLPFAAAGATLLVVAALAGLLLVRSHQNTAVEIAYWESVKSSRDAARFEQYLKEYPQGRFAALARAEIESRKRPAAAQPPAENRPAATPRTTAAPSKPLPPAAPRRIRVDGDVQAGKLIHQPSPVYPPMTRQARVQGAVLLDVVIGRDGEIANLRVVKGHPWLAKAALEAVRQWKYQPTLVNGKPVEVFTRIEVNFDLQ